MSEEVRVVKRHMLTTFDNPYHPFTHFKEWYVFDTLHGYNTSSLLGRISTSSDEMSEADQLFANETAIDEVLEHDVEGVYRKIAADDPVIVL
mgnify:CR=1 FL=1